MDSTKIEHLLKNYKVADIVQIQKGLKADVEKKKNDLKSLIGERYNELLEATDLVVHMTQTVEGLIESLSSLDVLLAKTKIDSKTTIECNQESATRKNYADYCDLLLVKRLLDLPLRIWDTLEQGDVCLATFHYFYGLNQSASLRRDKSHLLTSSNHLLRFNQIKLRSLNVYIREKCWSILTGKLVEHEIDYLYFANVLACLLLLTPCNASQLFAQFYGRQAEQVLQFLQQTNQLSVCFERVLNVIINTIRCSNIFQVNGAQCSILESQFDLIINKTYCQYCPTEPDYRFAMDVDRASLFTRESDPSVDYLQNWLITVKNAIKPIFVHKLNATNSIREVFDQINVIDAKISEDSRFSEWRIAHNIDVHQTIWREAVLNLFEDRVLEICKQSIACIEQTLEATLKSNEQFMSESDINIVESIWCPLEANSSNNQFLKLVDRSCHEINERFAQINQEVGILKDNFQTSLVAICSSIEQLLTVTFGLIIDACNLEKRHLFAAIFFKTLPTKCDKIEAIFDLQTCKSSMVSWSTVQAKLSCTSEQSFSNWFESIIDGHLAKLELEQFTQLNRFLHNLTVWESVALSLTNEDEKDKNVTSSMNVPSQLSLSIYNLLDGVCRDMNRYCAYSLAHSVLLHILSMLGAKLFDFYGRSIEVLEKNCIPKAAKQTMCIQLYFDLLFLKMFYASSRNETFRCSHVAHINTLTSKLENSIDPFDMHILYPILQSNAERLFQSCSIVFGLLILNRLEQSCSNRASSVKSLKSVTSSGNVRHNIMLTLPN